MHADFLKTVGLETSSAQSVSAARTYDAFGLPAFSSGSSASVFGFAGGWGYQEDPDSGLKLLGHRYYDPSTGRFLTRDPAKDGRNWYAYCGNNPIKLIDCNGCLALAIANPVTKNPAVLAAVVITGILCAAAEYFRKAVDASDDVTDQVTDDAVPIEQPKSPSGLIPVWRLGYPRGEFWAFEDPRQNPNYYYDYGMYTSCNPGTVVSHGWVDPKEYGAKWYSQGTKDFDGTPLNNGKQEVVVITSDAVKFPEFWPFPEGPRFFKPR